MIKLERRDQKQTTISRKIELAGRSMKSGRSCRMKCFPAKPDTGIVFQVSVPALIDSTADRRDKHTTMLQAAIPGVEHLLSAIWGSGIDNLIAEIGEDGVPFADGSAETYSKCLKVRELPVSRTYLEFDSPYMFGRKGQMAIFTPSDRLKVESVIAFDNIIGSQFAEFDETTDDYKRDIAPARTFLSRAVDKDGKEWRRVREEIPFLPEDPTNAPIITYTEEKMLTPLKFDNEPARHKILDFIGDIALLGVRVKAGVKLVKPSHAFTRELVEKLKREVDILKNGV